uniref:Variant surface glycoprotein 1125.3097 n=1 Tax=Trypanosoma brucei TaxID=5691 RepID=A0A1J0R984_9TRYP|nr:variant surface glycoprotein 1125.3097 [Trypanosoma brucei]
MTKVWDLARGVETDPKKKHFYAVLKAYATTLLKQVAKAQNEKMHKEVDLIVAMSRHEGYLRGRQHAFELQKTATLGTATTPDSTTCKQTMTITARPDSSCNFKTLADAGVNVPLTAPTAATKIKVSDTTDLAVLTNGATLTNTLASDTFSRASGTTCITANSGTGTLTAGITWPGTTETGTTPKPLKQTTHGETKCKDAPSSTADEPPSDRLARLLCEAQQSAANPAPSLAAITPEAIKNSPEALQAANNLMMGPKKVSDPTTGEGKTAVQGALQELIGDASNFSATFITGLKSTRVSFKKLEKDQPEKSLEDIARSDDFEVAVSYFEGKSMLAVADAAKKACKPQITETEETCNKKGQNECKSPCKWKENATDANKKCTLSEEANKEVEGKKEDGKPTNTTASNSFVINKVPLWPEFSLF